MLCLQLKLQISSSSLSSITTLTSNTKCTTEHQHLLLTPSSSVVLASVAVDAHSHDLLHEGRQQTSRQQHQHCINKPQISFTCKFLNATLTKVEGNSSWALRSPRTQGSRLLCMMQKAASSSRFRPQGAQAAGLGTVQRG